MKLGATLTATVVGPSSPVRGCYERVHLPTKSVGDGKHRKPQVRAIRSGQTSLRFLLLERERGTASRRSLRSSTELFAQHPPSASYPHPLVADKIAPAVVNGTLRDAKTRRVGIAVCGGIAVRGGIVAAAIIRIASRSRGDRPDRERSQSNGRDGGRAAPAPSSAVPTIAPIPCRRWR